LATKPRGWTGTRTPSALKRVRTTLRRTAINGPRRSEAKTLVSKAVRVAAGTTAGDPEQALLEALSALDRAANAGAIHPNAAARRKSRLTRKVNAAIGGERVQGAAKVTRTTGTAAAAKAAKARIAAGKAAKAKGAQTAAGKARAALSKTARTEAAEAGAKQAAGTVSEAPATGGRSTRSTTRPAARSTSKGAASKTATSRTAASKPAAKASPRKAAPKE
jgi:ribosomal protein S20